MQNKRANTMFLFEVGFKKKIPDLKPIISPKRCLMY